MGTISAPGQSGGRSSGRHGGAYRDEARRRRARRALPVIALASVAFASGAIVAANVHRGSSRDALAARFTAAWAKGDYAAMYSEIDSGSRGSVTAGEFAQAYGHALALATATRTTVTGKPRNLAGSVEVPVRVRTRLFGTLQSAFRLKIGDAGEGPRVSWSRSLAFPGMAPGEELGRRTTLPRRAPLLARDGSVLAEGAATQAGERNSPLGSVASAVLGSVGPLPAARGAALEAEGVPPGAIVGLSGVERALDDRLRGTPGGELLAQARLGAPGRVLASAAPLAAPAVRTTVSPAVQRAAVSALGGQYGGIVALAPTGEVLAVAGIGLDGVQPPGSTFKLVTTTGVLQAGVATPRSTFPYRTFATLDGVKLSNANGEECGGTLAVAFASSCNSVFAPLGAKLGAARLVATAERFGFNQDPGIAGAAESTLPPAVKIQGELDVGSTAIGQGQVQASALEMATVAATIADGGQRPRPTFLPAAPPAASVPVTSAAVARTMRRLMIGVVRAGTGTAAAIPGVTVAGKTGTAELKTATCATGPEQSAGAHEAGSECGAAKEPSNTDAWFAAFAPALRPRIVVGVLLVKDGAGGETAAPVARQVLEAGLKGGG
jgi:peptidoglycan glycosyltransferase